jgi:Lrp/AsnC family transcriptional regulator for asnA, asnC and gidA
MHAYDFHGLTVDADLDDVDRRIVRHLQEDGRRSVSTIAKDLGLSHAGVRQRVQRLLESRVVQIGAVTAPGTHGYTQMTFVGVRADHRIQAVAAAVTELDEAYYVVVCSGAVDVMAEVMCRDERHLLELIERIRAIDGVVETQSFAFVELVKWRYAPGFPEDGQAAAPAAAAGERG